MWCCCRRECCVYVTKDTIFVYPFKCDANNSTPYTAIYTISHPIKLFALYFMAVINLPLTFSTDSSVASQKAILVPSSSASKLVFIRFYTVATAACTPLDKNKASYSMRVNLGGKFKISKERYVERQLRFFSIDEQITHIFTIFFHFGVFGDGHKNKTKKGW